MDKDELIDISGKFSLSSYNPSNFILVSQEIFHRGSGIGTRQVKLHDDAIEGFIELHFNKNGKIAKLYASKDLDKLIINRLQKSLMDLNTDLPEEVGQAVIFSTNITVDGGFKYKDLFQILPVPDDAPKIGMLVGEHPFLLQYKYSPANNMVISNARSIEKKVLYARLLNLFCHWSMHWGQRTAEMSWVFNEDATSSEFRTHAYIHPGIDAKIDKFTPIKSQIKLEKEEEHYNFRNPSRSVTLPLHINDFLDKALSIDGETRDKFYRAITWFDLSSNLNAKSSSASYIALVSSIECLLDESSVRCKCCGQPQYKISSKFKEFMKKYTFDNFPDEKEVNKLIDRYYSLRSSISHGGVLMAGDLRPWEFISNKSFEEQEVHRSLYPNVKIAIINWLMSQ